MLTYLFIRVRTDYTVLGFHLVEILLGGKDMTVIIVIAQDSGKEIGSLILICECMKKSGL